MNDRAKYLGGSDAAAVLGVSPYRTPLQLYQSKRGELELSDEDRVRERMLERGKREEPHIVDDLIKLHGVKVTKRSTPKNPNRYTHPKFPFIAAEIDFEWEVTTGIVEHFRDYSGFEIPKELIGTMQNGEVKTMHPFAARRKIGEEGTDEFPIEYMAQTQHGLMVTGRQLCLVAFGVYCDDPLIYWAKADNGIILPMLGRECEFWSQNVLAGVPPAPVNLPDVKRLLGKATSTRKEATPEIAAAVRALHLLGERKRIAEEGIDALQYEIGVFMLGAEVIEKQEKPGLHVLAYEGVPIEQISLQHQDRVDTELLKKKFPEVAEQVAKRISFFRYSKPRAKP